ncbi:hypothetical protein BD408DRAFT_346689, partial [Parasitella parasitica]
MLKYQRDAVDLAANAHYNRDSTNKMYDLGWDKYEEWCKERKLDPFLYGTKQVLEFITCYSHLAPSTLNGYRSAIASVLSVLYPHHPPLAEDPDIMAFFRAKRQKTTKVSSLATLETWDTDILANYIVTALPPSSRLSLYDLQQKLVLLLCLHTMWRPRSDIGTLQFRDTVLRRSEDGSLLGLILQIRQPKEAQ